jgi:hypothetical protein
MPVVTPPVYVPKRLAQSLPAVTTDATIYSTPGGDLTIVKQIIVANVGTVSALASISFVPNGVAVADGNRVCKDINIDPKRVVIFDLAQVMASGDFISVKTSVASTLVFTASGVETTALTFPPEGLEVAEAGVIAGIRPRINFIEGANVSLTVIDDPVNGEVDVTVAVPQAGHTILLEGSPYPTRAGLHFIEGSNIDITVADDAGNDETLVTVAVSGNLGHVIKDEGTPLATRAGLNFIGPNVTVNDDAANDETEVIIAGGEVDPLVHMGGW